MGSHWRGMALVLVLLLLLAPGTGSAGFAGHEEAAIAVDGRVLPLSPPPVLDGNRVLAPLRGLFDQLGAQVEWDGEARRVTIKGVTTQISLEIDKRTAYVGRREVLLDSPPRLIEGRTYVPVRFVAEALGKPVAWDGNAGVVRIGAASPPGRGKELYLNTCAVCHGTDRQGGAVGITLEGAVDRIGPIMIKNYLRNGLNYMPPFDLTDEEMDEVISYLKNP